MKIKRQDCQEEYKITVDWINDFAKSLQKKSYNIENIKNINQIGKIPNSFATIEEKMADIKDRVGFAIIKQIHENNEKIITAASQHPDCPCGGPKPNKCSCPIKTAKVKNTKSKNKLKKQKVKLMNNVLKYIKQLCQHEHDRLTPNMVISRCRQEDGLGFDDLPIQMDKLLDFIEKTLEQYEQPEIEIIYTPIDNSRISGDLNSQSEFWMHAFPQR